MPSSPPHCTPVHASLGKGGPKLRLLLEPTGLDGDASRLLDRSTRVHGGLDDAIRFLPSMCGPSTRFEVNAPQAGRPTAT